MAPLLRALRSDQSGNSVIEFAFGLPILLAVSLTGVELANLALVHARVSQIAHMAADNASKVRLSIDETDVKDTFYGVNEIGSGIEFLQNGRVIVTQLLDNAATATPTNDNIVLWQRCKGVKTPPTLLPDEGDIITTEMALPGKSATVATPQDPMIFVEVYYEYSPKLKWAQQLFGIKKEVRYSSSYVVRDRQDNSIKNGQSLGNAQKDTCEKFSSSV